ncbi:MAG: hypothetical protein V4615_05150 [Bacteroidota bacterium]
MKKLILNVKGEKDNYEVIIPCFVGNEKNCTEVARKYMVHYGSNHSAFIREMIELGRYEVINN